MLKKLQKGLSTLEFGYFLLLPFLGYIAIYQLNSTSFGVNYLPLTGLAFLLYYQVMVYTFYQVEQQKAQELIFAIIPPFLIGLNLALLDGTIWHFFLEETVMEVVALMLGLSIFLIFTKNEDGISVWDDRTTTVAAIVLVGLFVLAAMGFITTWWDIQFYSTKADTWHIVNFIVAFLFQIRINVLALKQIGKGKVKMEKSTRKEEVGNDNLMFFFLFGQVIIWALVIPVVYMILKG